MYRFAFPAAALMLSLAACGGATSVKTSPDSPATPAVSLSPDDSGSGSSASTVSADMGTASSFVTNVYTEDWDTAATQVADNSVAARYVTHQIAAAQVDDLNGASDAPSSDEIDVTTEGDTVSVEDSSVDKPVSYVWKNFTFEGGKIASWEVEGRANVDSRLWHAKSSDSDEGVSADLVSAYQGNSKDLTVVVSIRTNRNVILEGTTYTPKDGYKHEDTVNWVSDIDKGDKTLTYFAFKKSNVGGILKIKFDTKSYEDLTTLELKVR